MADGRQAQDPKGHPSGVTPESGSHGSSVAAWTGVGTIIVGALIMSIAVVIASVTVFVVGVIVVVLGIVAGKVLSVMGFGAPGRPGQ